MATLWIREYERVAGVGLMRADGSAVGGARESVGVPMPMAEEPGTDQTPVAFSTSAQSAAFAASTRFIAIIASDAFHYVVGASPTATTGALKVPADTLFFVGVTPGQKIAAIAAA